MQLTLKVFGRVQEVWFRDSARREAEKLGIVGFARNEKDGSVLVVAVGRRADLAKFEKWCGGGPTGAKVDRVLVERSETGLGFGGFSVR